MGAKTIKGKDLIELGFKEGRVVGIALNVMAKHFKKKRKAVKLQMLTDLLADPVTEPHQLPSQQLPNTFTKIRIRFGIRFRWLAAYPGASRSFSSCGA